MSCLKTILVLASALSIARHCASAYDNINASFFIEDETDIEIMAKLVLMRDHVIIDPTAASEIDETMMNKLMNFIYINSNRPHTPGGRLILPALDGRDIGCDAVSQQDERIG